MKKKLLLIKTGHAETFTEEISSNVCSLGDVFRTSIIIPLLGEYQITWLLDPKALPLVENIKDIDFIIGSIPPDSLKQYDYVLNLEKNDEYLNLEHSYGLVRRDGVMYVRPFLSDYFLPFENLKNDQENSFQRKLMTILNCEREEFDYPADESSYGEAKYNIGLNWKVGPKWPEKSLDESFWVNLEKELSPHYKISWQEGFEDLRQYQDWISSCQTIITLDSLGLHLAVALRKNVIALFGPTNANEIDLFNRGQKFFYRSEEERELLSSKITEYLLKSKN